MSISCRSLSVSFEHILKRSRASWRKSSSWSSAVLLGPSLSLSPVTERLSVETGYELTCSAVRAVSVFGRVLTIRTPAEAGLYVTTPGLSVAPVRHHDAGLALSFQFW